MAATLLAWIALTFTASATAYFFGKYLKFKKITHALFALLYLTWTLISLFGIFISYFGFVLNNEPLSTIFFRLSASTGTISYSISLLFAVAFTEPQNLKRDATLLLIPIAFILFLIWFTPTTSEMAFGTIEFTFQSTYKEPFGLPVIEIILSVVWGISAISLIYFASYMRQLRGQREWAIYLKLFVMVFSMGTVLFFYGFEMTSALTPELLSTYRLFTVLGTLIMPFSFLLPEEWLRSVVGG